MDNIEKRVVLGKKILLTNQFPPCLIRYYDLLIVLHDIMTVQKLYISVPSKDPITNQYFRQLTPSSYIIGSDFPWHLRLPNKLRLYCLQYVVFVYAFMLPSGNPSCQLALLYRNQVYFLSLLYISLFFVCQPRTLFFFSKTALG